MITEEASASPLTLSAREQVPKFADLLWHCFGGASTSRKFRGLRIRLLWPDRAPIRHIGKKPQPRALCIVVRIGGEYVCLIKRGTYGTMFPMGTCDRREGTKRARGVYCIGGP